MATNTLQQVYESSLIENLFKESNWMMESVDHSRNVIGEIVHVPNAGAKVGIEINRSTFPATATERDDNDLTYAVDSFTADPYRIRNAVEFQTAYSYRQSLMMNITEGLRESIGNHTLNNWAGLINVNGGTVALSNTVKTTGADKSDNLPNATATGTRKALTLADWISAVSVLDSQNISKEGRVAVLPYYMYYELVNTPDVINANKIGSGETPVVTGAVNRLWGVDIFTRSTVNTYATGDTLKAVGSAEAVGDLGGAIMYNKNSVCLAKGDIKSYSNSGDGNGDPLNYGTLLSGEVLMGSSRLRADGFGVVAIVQTVGA